MEKKIAIIIDANGQATVGEVDDVTGAFTRLGDEGEKAGQRVGRGAGEIDKATKKWEESGRAIGIVAGTLLTATTAIVGYQLKVADETGKMAERLGVSTEFISQMGFAAKRVSGVDLRGFEDALGTLGDQAAKAEQGMKRPAAAFKSLGIDVTDSNGKLKSLEQLLPQVADKFEQMKDGPREAAIATALFGSEGKKLLLLLNQGADGMAHWRERAVELGLSLSKETTQGAAELTDNVGLLHVAVQGMVNGWVKDALPAMVAVSGELAGSAEQTAKAGGSYTALGLIIKTLATAYYFLETVVKDVVNVVAAGVDTLEQILHGTGVTIATWFKGVTGAANALIHGDLKGAFNAFSGMMSDFKANGEATIGGIRAAWSSAIDGIGLSQEDFSRKVSDVWMPAAAGVKSSSEQATGAVDGLGDGFLGLTPKIDEAAKRAQRAADQLDRLIGSLKGKAATTEVDQEAAAYDAVKKRIDALEREMGDLGKLTEYQVKLTEARNVAAAAHERQLRIAEGADRERERELDLVARSLDHYREEAPLLWLSNEAREAEELVLRATNEAREQYNKGLRDTATLSEAEAASIRAGAALYIKQREEAEGFRDSWLNAVSSVSQAFGDWMVNGLDKYDDFGDAVVGITKRWLSDVIAQFARNDLFPAIGNWLSGLANGGFAGAGSAGGGGSFFGGLLNVFGRVLSGGSAQPGAAMAGGSGWVGLGTSIGSVFTPSGAAAAAGYGTAGASANYGSSLMSAAGMYQGGSLASAGSFFGKGGMGSYLSAIAGAVWGYKQGGDTAGKILGAAAGGAAGYGLSIGAGAAMTAYAGGTAGVAAGSAGAAATAGLGAIPVVGWIALAAIAVNAISGGKLFGTKYKLESAQTNYTYGDSGIGGSTDVTKVKQRSLFRGRKWTTSTQALSDDARQAMNEAFGAIDDAVTQAATQLGISVPNLLGAQFTQQFDDKGKLRAEFGTIAGRVYREAQDAFNQRYLAENLLNVAGIAGGHRSTVQELANPYRSSPEALTDFSTLMLAIAGDAKTGKLLWDDTDDALRQAVATLKLMQQTGESLASTYQRVSQGVTAYAEMIGGVRNELLMHGLSDYAQAQVQIELQYRAQVKQANDLAKALGLSGARAEDLASIEQLRAQRMADLQQQMEAQRDQFLGQLRISDLAPGTDQSKFTDAMQQLRDAVGRGDLQQAEQLAQTVLGYNQRINASGSDANAVYNTVTGLLNQLDPADAGLTPNLLQDIVDELSTLDTDIASSLFQMMASSQAPLAPPPAASASQAPSSSGNPKRDVSPVTHPSNDALLGAMDEIAKNTREMLREQKRVAMTVNA